MVAVSTGDLTSRIRDLTVQQDLARLEKLDGEIATTTGRIGWIGEETGEGEPSAGDTAGFECECVLWGKWQCAVAYGEMRMCGFDSSRISRSARFCRSSICPSWNWPRRNTRIDRGSWRQQRLHERHWAPVWRWVRRDGRSSLFMLFTGRSLFFSRQNSKLDSTQSRLSFFYLWQLKEKFKVHWRHPKIQASFDWLIDWFIHWSIDWLIDWFIHWSIDWLIDVRREVLFVRAEALCVAACRRITATAMAMSNKSPVMTPCKLKSRPAWLFEFLCGFLRFFLNAVLAQWKWSSLIFRNGSLNDEDDIVVGWQSERDRLDKELNVVNKSLAEFKRTPYAVLCC